ncbi:MAG: hypothetical protein U1F98_01720 [Verrucomicrobiota bacterium]
MPNGFRQASRWLAIALALFAALGVPAALAWKYSREPKIAFLPRIAPSEWIVYPAATTAISIQPRLPLATEFTTEFILDTVPSSASLRAAAFGNASVRINGQPAALDSTSNWKTPREFDPAPLLVRGTNTISVSVLNSNGPPALWLALEAGPARIRSDETWQASYAGATPTAARLASRPKWDPPGNPLHAGEPSLGEALRAAAPCLALFTALSAALVYLAGKRPADFSKWLLPALALAWAALFANNLGALPPRAGFDASGHLAYIRFIQEHHALPAADQGWEMFQPPLYYLLSAGLLGSLGLTVADPAAVTALRLFGLAIGLLHLGAVNVALRAVFPGDNARRKWGLLLAAAMPPLLYLSQFVTNEAFAAMLASATVAWTLRLLRRSDDSWLSLAALGALLGLSLLAKSTTVLLLPVVIGTLAWHWADTRATPARNALPRAAMILALCLAIGGWHYARAWMHYGNPLIGVWDPRLADWWQDDGYRTSAFFLPTGDGLAHPWFASLKSFPDGIYSTLWGDGLAGGAGDFFGRPPWNYPCMAASFWLALLPTAGILIGLLAATRRFLRQPTAQWFLLLGLIATLAIAVVHMSITVPYSCMVKSFYGMAALVPVCALGALGLETLAGRARARRAVVAALFGLWCLASFGSFWIVRSTTPAIIGRVNALIESRRYPEMFDLLHASLARNPADADLRYTLAQVDTSAGMADDALSETARLTRDHPADPRAPYLASVNLEHKGQVDEALVQARRSVELAPGFASGWEQLARLELLCRQYPGAEAAARRGLQLAPFNPKLRFALACSRAAARDEPGAREQLDLSRRLGPAWPDATTLLDAARSSAAP